MLNSLFIDTRSGYHRTLVAAVGLLFSFAVFLAGGSLLASFVQNPGANMFSLAGWVVLVVVCSLILSRMRSHGVITVTPSEIIQHQISLSTHIPIKEIKSYEIVQSTRTVAQNGVTVRVPRLLLEVHLQSGKKIPLVISVFNEPEQLKIKKILDKSSNWSLSDLSAFIGPDSTISRWFIWKAVFYFICLSAIVPGILILYGQK